MDKSATQATASEAEASRIDNSIREFVGGGKNNESRELSRLGRTPGFTLSFNWVAFLLGSLWYGARGLWGFFIALVLAETLAIFLLGYGAFGDFGAAEAQRAQGIAATIEARQSNLADALAAGSDSVEMLRRNIDELEKAHAASLLAVEAAGDSRPKIVRAGIFLLAVLRLVAGSLANFALLQGFVTWQSDRGSPRGFSMRRLGAGALFLVFVCSIGYMSLFPGVSILDAMAQWDLKSLRRGAATGIDTIFDTIAFQGEGFFDVIQSSLATALQFMERMLVNTPMVIVYAFIVLIAWRLAGSRIAILTGAALAYIILFGFWEKAMMTTALLGTAALICISIGVPMGIWCGRSNAVYRAVRPVLDFMQTMPSFVYLIPVIAFFGTGKIPAIIATMVFGTPPVIRLTTLGIRNVPESIREAAIAFGATKRYLLLKVDLPLAAPSIMAGINQTILLCLSMVVVASLIGAKGLGEEVLIALQYAAAGDGVLAGLAILCCAIIFDRIVEGKRKLEPGR